MGWAEDVAKAVAAVKQGSGVVGKLSTVGCFAFLAMGVGLYAMPGEPAKMWAMLAGILVVASAFLIFVRLALGYAERNPLGAGMESGDLMQVHLRQLEIAANDQTASVPTANVAAPKTAAEPLKSEGGKDE